jgi:hypothetical protein
MDLQRSHSDQTSSRQRAAELRWTRSSYYLLSAFLATLFLLAYVWWPLAKEYLEQFDTSQSLWRQVDWLLIGIFLLMSLLIMAGADLKKDIWILTVGLAGGLVIESWGTQTEIWTYYTLERPPLWIIPAWPIASLSIDRLVRISDRYLLNNGKTKGVVAGYWVAFAAFMGLMFYFVWPTLDKPLTIFALLLCTFLILTPTDHRLALLTFGAGTGLGFFLEYWGTTRLCWTYYTEQTPPLFAVFAHGMAAVAFWRSVILLKSTLKKSTGQRKRIASRAQSNSPS